MLDEVKKFIEGLKKTENYREYFEEHSVWSWIYEYVYDGRDDTSKSIKNREYILYALLFVLNELKPFPKETMKLYLADVNLVLDDVIKAAYEEKEWYLFEDTDLALAAKIVDDYTNYTIRKESETYIADESKEELAIIFSNFLGCEPEKEFIEKFCYPSFDICVYPNSDKPVLKQIISNYSDMTYENLYGIVHVDGVRYK